MIEIPFWLINRPIIASDIDSLSRCLRKYDVNYFVDFNITILKKIYQHDKDNFFNLVKSLRFYGVSFSGKLSSYNGSLNKYPEVLSIPEKQFGIHIEQLVGFKIAFFESIGLFKAEQLYGVPLANIQHFSPLSAENINQQLQTNKFSSVKITGSFDAISFWHPLAELEEQKVRTVIELPDLDLSNLPLDNHIGTNGNSRLEQHESKTVNIHLNSQSTTDNISDYDEPRTQHVSTLDLSVRATNCLRKANIETIADLLEYGVDNLLSIRNFGRKTFREINEKFNIFLEQDLHLAAQHNLSKVEELMASDGAVANLAIAISDVQLSRRARGCLSSSGINFFYELVQFSENEVNKIKNMGRKTLKELKEILKNHGLYFGIPLSAGHIEQIQQYNPIGSVEELLKDNQLMAYLKMAISDIELSVRARGCLANYEIKYIYELVQLSEDDVRKIKNMGKKTIVEIKTTLKQYNLFFDIHLSIEQVEQIENYSILYNFDDFNWLKNITQELNLSDFSAFNLRQVSIIRERLWTSGKKKSLEDLGESFSVSRERIRQVEKGIVQSFTLKHKSKLSILSAFLKEEAEDYGYIYNMTNSKVNFDLDDNEQPIADFLLSLGPGNIIVDWKYHLISTIGNKGLGECFDKIAYKIKSEGTGEYFPEPYLLDVVSEVAQSCNILNDGDFFNFIRCFKLKKKITEDSYGLCFGRVLKSTKIAEAFKTHFPEGLDVYKESEKLLACLVGVDPKMFGKSSTRGAIGILTRQEDVLLWIRGFFIHKANVIYDLKVVEKVTDWVVGRFNSNHTRFQVSVPFSEFNDELTQAGVPNPYALYTLFRVVGNNRIGQRKYPTLVDLEADENLYDGIQEELEGYFIQEERAIPYAELKNEFILKRGWKEYSLFNNLTINSEVIFPWKNQTYIHIDLLPVNMGKLDELIRELTQKVQTINAPYSLKGAKKEMNVLWELSCQGAPVRTMTKLIRSVDPEDIRIDRYSVYFADSFRDNMSVVTQLEDFFLEQNSEVHSDIIKREFIGKRGWGEAQYYVGGTQAP